MVYLAELIVVMIDRLEIVRIRARNVPLVYTWTQALRLSLASLSLQESDSVVFSMRWGAVLLKHKNSPWDSLRICACLNKKVVATVCPHHFDTKSEQSDCN